jgi:hypothetical protein
MAEWPHLRFGQTKGSADPGAAPLGLPFLASLGGSVEGAMVRERASSMRAVDAHYRPFFDRQILHKSTNFAKANTSLGCLSDEFYKCWSKYVCR